jgi:hypothetical protein
LVRFLNMPAYAHRASAVPNPRLRNFFEPRTTRNTRMIGIFCVFRLFRG